MPIAPISIWGSDQEHVYVIGFSGLRCAASTGSCVTEATGTELNLSRIFGLNANNIYAVGEYGAILRRAP